MTESKKPGPVLFFTGVLAANEYLLAAAEEKLVAIWGGIQSRSGIFPFSHCHYYQKETGETILRQFFSFYGQFDRQELAIRKLQSNQLEKNIAAQADCALPRPVNIDPGYLAPEKLVLASCKNFAHRIYIGNGVFAEVTLLYRHGRFEALEWTFPDFADEKYHQFFRQERQVMMEAWY